MVSSIHSQVLYMDEIKKGNYSVFVRHVLDQISDSFKLGSSDIKLLNDYRDYLLSIGTDLVRTYCSAMSMTNTEFFKSNDCIGAFENYWRDLFTDVGKDEYWIRISIFMLRLFSANVGIATLITMPTDLALLAILRAKEDGKLSDQLINTLGKLSILVSAFYAETLIHLLTEDVGVPLSAFMLLAGNFVNEIIKAYDAHQ